LGIPGFQVLRFDRRPDLSQVPGFGEGLETAVVGSLGAVREAAGGQFLRGQVVLEALAAEPLVAAAGIGTIAVLEVLVFAAFHDWSTHHLLFAIYHLRLDATES
jgi:hypothetical protein